MADETNENILIAQRTQDKFEFYVIALSFTTLGLSIQTASFRGNLIADGLELLSWASLLVSSLIGLRRLEGKPHLYKLFSLHDEYEDRAKAVRKAQMEGIREFRSLADGSVVEASQALVNQESSVKQIADHIAPEQKRLSRLYRAQRALLVAGFALLVVARSYAPFVGIVLEVRRLLAG